MKLASEGLCYRVTKKHRSAPRDHPEIEDRIWYGR